ncbi:4Fe-4S binding protein [Irregularibacter muris]|uniref:4Fe-4S binding protein n=1 Tax=Irregularibacter muris TaxID=1796619 RepID=A0AAE3L1Y7_9FIRM|nr:[Fe-Fe] hydrogenase large subunit C-terminal domain-containing protein [Irregularibacter muris]MCR1897704.1 4Fe-4S binding protein [Irregularibacter muris]
MNIINFTKANCKNCYKCVRSCPVKAIKIKDEQAEIVAERCIGCGICLHSCPQNAKSIKSDLETIQEWIKDGQKVVVSIAPSFPAAFNLKKEGQIVTALKQLGFYAIEETAAGAEIISLLYKDFYYRKDYNHVITTSCPTVNYLIERYYPHLVKYMVPVVSPMIAHGRLLQRQFGQKVKIVFIGPCISKKFETLHFQHDRVIDAMITFDELHRWLEEENISIENLPSTSFGQTYCNRARWYPLAGGVALSSLDKEDKGRKILKIDGLENCRELLSYLDNGELENTWIEINACDGGCINGPGNYESPWGKYIREEKVKEYITKTIDVKKQAKNLHFEAKDVYKTFIERPICSKMPSPEEIKSILKQIGKHKKEDELNCGGCGYNTCREKAIAVYQGMAEKYMCLPYMRSRGETLSNFIIQNTPNAIIVLDHNFHIIEFNPSAEKLFHWENVQVLKKPIEMVMEKSGFNEVKNHSPLIYRGKRYLPSYDLVVIETVLYIKEQDMYLGIFSDITQEMSNKKALDEMKTNTLNMAQEVIDKQMRVAQEIASLLGETTAETKVTLTQLKKLVQGQEGDIYSGKLY